MGNDAVSVRHVNHPPRTGMNLIDHMPHLLKADLRQKHGPELSGPHLHDGKSHPHSRFTALRIKHHGAMAGAAR